MNSVMMMPGSGRNGTSPGYVTPPGVGFAMPKRSGSGSPTGWIIGSVLFAIASAYWYVGVGRAHTEAKVVRAWAVSGPVKATVRSAIQTPGSQRKRLVAARKTVLYAAFKTAAQKTGAKELAESPVPFALAQLIEYKLIKAPGQTVAALGNAASKVEATAFPLYSMNPKLVSDPSLYNYTGWGLLSGTAFFALAAITGMMPKKRMFAVPVTVATPVTASPVMTPRISPPITAPTIIPPMTASTPFPPPPDTVPTINPPMRGSIAAGVAAVASSSSEVTRLVKRLEELESLSERLKGERDETRKELSWTQVALDDFKKRVADATTMAAASAAQSAGASEQRAAQAEQRVTEAVEHINEALLRAVETEHGVSRAKELAQTAEERASHAEIRSQEIQFQLSRAMERLADLEQLAVSTRFGGMPNGATLGNRIQNAPSPPGNDGDRNGLVTFVPSPIDDMLAAAAKHPPEIKVRDEPMQEPAPVVAESIVTSNIAPRGQRVPPPRLTNTKMADIEAGLNLARSIRSRTQKAAAKTNTEE
ncbi:MAG: hypothetical protein H7145_17825 [Akkermansiaceae bacterium]|nr:hypothetical protein [Armatimonadota bacterium]